MATKVTLAGVQYDYRFDFGSMLHYERLTASIKDITPKMQIALTHYSCLLSGGCTMAWDEFLAAVDSSETLNQLTVALESESKRWNVLNGESKKDVKSKKK